jgi:N4-gp56 family major capsid protein
MAVKNFIPEIWSAQLLTSLKKSLVYGAPDVANRNYEGEIAERGDTVKITSISRPTVDDYEANVTVITPEELTDAQRSLLVDQSKYFAFKVDDVDKRQAAGNVMPEAMAEAAYALRDVADRYIAGLYTGVIAANALGTVNIATGTDAYEQLVELGVKLDEADVPSEGRWVVLPPWYHGKLRNNPNFINAEKSADGGAALRNGIIGEAAGFSVRKSNNTPSLDAGDDNIVIAGYPGAISFAEQINKVEAYRPESSFSDAMKGLHLYGAKLVRPNAIATLQASRSA